MQRPYSDFARKMGMRENHLSGWHAITSGQGKASHPLVMNAIRTPNPPPERARVGPLAGSVAFFEFIENVHFVLSTGRLITIISSQLGRG